MSAAAFNMSFPGQNTRQSQAIMNTNFNKLANAKVALTGLALTVVGIAVEFVGMAGILHDHRNDRQDKIKLFLGTGIALSGVVLLLPSIISCLRLQPESNQSDVLPVHNRAEIEPAPEPVQLREIPFIEVDLAGVHLALSMQSVVLPEGNTTHRIVVIENPS